jgi:xylan 1,4-beta-xylosidase
VFEEGGPIDKPFTGQFGLRAKGGINKPSYYAYGLLHQLGEQRIANPSNQVIVTKTKDGGLAIAAWNLVDPEQHGAKQTLEFAIKGVAKDAAVTVERVDDRHGNVLPKYAAMGSPVDPTPEQAEELNHETALGPPTTMRLEEGKIRLELVPNALVLIKILAVGAQL